jgi:hypothetical protein
LSLHILDIAENSITAGAHTVEIVVREESAQDMLMIEISDDGKGLDPEAVRQAAGPFYTTRTTRRVGLGLALLDEAAKATGGSMTVQSTPGVGTKVTASFHLSHIDCKPIGNIADTITALIGRPSVDILYRHERNGEVVLFNTKSFKQLFDDMPMNSAQTLNFIRAYLTQEEDDLMQHV